MHEKFCISIFVFCGKASFTSKQSEKSSQGVHNYKLAEGRTQLHVCLAGTQEGVTPIPANHQTLAQFPVQVETIEVDLKIPVICLCYPNTSISGKRTTGGNLLEGICLIIKINIYIEIQFNLVAFLTFSQFYKSHRGLIRVFSS